MITGNSITDQCLTRSVQLTPAQQIINQENPNTPLLNPEINQQLATQSNQARTPITV